MTGKKKPPRQGGGGDDRTAGQVSFAILPPRRNDVPPVDERTRLFINGALFEAGAR